MRSALLDDMQTTDKPHWFDAQANAWERAKEAVRRDWEQTKHELHLGGHELNQDVEDTVTQAVGSAPIPAIDAPNPPKVIGQWQDLEAPIGFGYAARRHYGARFPKWTSELEKILAADWKRETQPWDSVKPYVRHGYEVAQG